MAYSKFTLSRATQELQIRIIEGQRFFLNIPPVKPTPLLLQTLDENVPWAIAVGSEKARSEGIVNPVLLEVKRQLKGQISVFSGEEFNVDIDRGLNGYVDFLIGQTASQLYLEAPVVVLVEAKKEDLKSGLGQCVAEMVAAQQFNREHDTDIKTIYGTVTSGTVWLFLKLEEQVVTIDLTDYSIDPIEQLLGFLVWMAGKQ
jgi:hypothetical protein